LCAGEPAVSESYFVGIDMTPPVIAGYAALPQTFLTNDTSTYAGYYPGRAPDELAFVLDGNVSDSLCGIENVTANVVLLEDDGSGGLTETTTTTIMNVDGNVIFNGAIIPPQASSTIVRPQILGASPWNQAGGSGLGVTVPDTSDIGPYLIRYVVTDCAGNTETLEGNFYVLDLASALDRVLASITRVEDYTIPLLVGVPQPVIDNAIMPPLIEARMDYQHARGLWRQYGPDQPPIIFNSLVYAIEEAQRTPLADLEDNLDNVLTSLGGSEPLGSGLEFAIAEVNRKRSEVTMGLVREVEARLDYVQTQGLVAVPANQTQAQSYNDEAGTTVDGNPTQATNEVRYAAYHLDLAIETAWSDSIDFIEDVLNEVRVINDGRPNPQPGYELFQITAEDLLIATSLITNVEAQV
ncbi:MAG: hypothetical protein KC561_19905, partial [Myxococcales bacterium]|nr:hypothetical protein [Myxococcales bacterium]